MNSPLARNAFRVLAAAVLAAGAVVGSAGSALAADTARPTHLSPALPRVAPAASRVDQAGIATILAKHNSARDEVRVSHLSWDNGLANDAQAFADKIAAQNLKNPDHDRTELARLNQWENLAWSFGTQPLQFAVDFWYGERPKYLAATNKTIYTSDEARGFGHYTQMVWATTTKIGCGMATGTSGERFNYVACRYQVPGNQNGQLAFPGAAGGVKPGPCKPGFVPREAFPGDGVCVTPATRRQVEADNKAAASRVAPGTNGYGPNACAAPYVWREARPSDLVCVLPEQRTQARADNAAAGQRRAS